MKQKHAHWECHYECSNCGEMVRQIQRECPFCHAIMDESPFKVENGQQISNFSEVINEVKSDDVIGCKPSPVGCPYLTSVENRNQGTSYPVCGCGYRHCDEYRGYCPIRDER